ncbi:MAG: phosphopentomutase [Oscillospiraceae bacterium]
MIKRVFLIVLDSVGIGAAPDAAKFGDAGANTLASIAKSPEYSTPCLAQLGLFNIDGVTCGKPAQSPEGCFARMTERSQGKDTTIGHWEIAGVISEKPLPTYPNGFPRDFLEKFEKAVGRKTMCNLPYSGIAVIDEYGERHMKTGDLIVYTSADSVFQIAANEAVVPLDELYEICRTARKLLDETGNAVGRVIARPFIGADRASFKRTSNRHDFSLQPPATTMLDSIKTAGLATIGVGKIFDIFAGKSVSERIPIKNNDDGMTETIALAKRDFSGLAFVNLVDFDMVYGHRNDVDGYASAMSAFDRRLCEIMPLLHDDDLLMITADHGCDPDDGESTDHTREHVPMIVCGKEIKQGVNLGTRSSFADMGKTVCDSLDVPSDIAGESFWQEIKK